MKTEARYRCTFTGKYQPEANRSRTEEFYYGTIVKRWPGVVDFIDQLEVGHRAVDYMGDTWERIA